MRNQKPETNIDIVLSALEAEFRGICGTGGQVHPVCAVSQRLATSLARAYPASSLIRVHPELGSQPTALIREVLAHELAHLCVHAVYGPTAKPHGAEWKNLMATMGFEPRVNIAWTNRRSDTIEPYSLSRLYRHRCPICQFVRYSSRPQRRWRCAACAAVGLLGVLEIDSLSADPKASI